MVINFKAFVLIFFSWGSTSQKAQKLYWLLFKTSFKNGHRLGNGLTHKNLSFPNWLLMIYIDQIYSNYFKNMQNYVFTPAHFTQKV